MKKFRLTFFALFAAMTLAFGLVVAQQQENEQAVEDVMQQYEESFNAGDAAGAAERFTENSIYYTAVGQVIEGREALWEYYQEAIDAGFAELSLETIETEVLNTAAHHTGSYTLLDPEGEPLEGYYMAIFSREDDEWRMYRLVVNMAMPEPETGARDEQAVENVVRQYEERFNTEDAGGIAELYTEDGTHRDPFGGVHEGREAVQGYYQSLFDAGVTDMSLEVLEVRILNDTAYQIGSHSATAPDGETAGGFFMTIFTWENDQWSVHRQIGNMAMPEPEMDN